MEGESESSERSDALAMIRRIAERELVPLRPLEPEVNVVLPREADAAVHLYAAVRRTRVDVGERRLRHRGRARGLARRRILRVPRIPDERAGRLDVGRDLGGDVLERLER